MTKHTKENDRLRLRKIVESFPKLTVTVLADLVADEFVFGEISRVSREAPVLILTHRDRKVVPGGGANAIYNLADLGVNVLPVGVVGDDEPGKLLLRAFRHKRIPISGVFKDKSYSTVTKTRILAGFAHTAGQQVVRLDREPSEGPNSHLRREIVLAAREYRACLRCPAGFRLRIRRRNAIPAECDSGKARTRQGSRDARLAPSHARVFRGYGGNAQ